MAIEYDHLGNTRTVYTAEFDGCAAWPNVSFAFTIESAADYFPYGKVLRQFPNLEELDRFLSTGNERDKTTGYDYRLARMYDSDLGRFLSLDPLHSNFHSWSPFSYSFCNAIKLIDPTGLEPELSGDERRQAKTKKRAKKLEEKVHIPLNNLWEETQDETKVNNEAKRLENKYQGRRWMRGVNQNYRSDGTNFKSKSPVTIVPVFPGMTSYGPYIGSNPIPNGFPYMPGSLFSDPQAIWLGPNQQMTFNFDAATIPNQLIIMGTGNDGGVTNLWDTGPPMAGIMNNNASPITSANEQRISFQVNQAPAPGLVDQWHLQIFVSFGFHVKVIESNPIKY